MAVVFSVNNKMISCKRETHGFLGKPRFVAEIPADLTPRRLVRAPAPLSMACLLLEGANGSGQFWLIDCTQLSPEVHAIPTARVPDAFAFCVLDRTARIFFEKAELRYALATQTVMPTRALAAKGAVLACTDAGGLVTCDRPDATYYNADERVAYEISGANIEARAVPEGAVRHVGACKAITDRPLDTGWARLFFASGAEAALGPGPAVERESHVVVPWECRVHPHTHRYLRAQGEALRVGRLRAAGWNETHVPLDGAPLAWDWIDADGFCAATSGHLHILFTEAEDLGWADFLLAMAAYRLPFVFLVICIIMANQED